MEPEKEAGCGGRPKAGRNNLPGWRRNGVGCKMFFPDGPWVDLVPASFSYARFPGPVIVLDPKDPVFSLTENAVYHRLRKDPLTDGAIILVLRRYAC